MKPYQGSHSGYRATDRAPRLDHDRTAFRAPAKMRSRKVWKKRADNDSDE